MESSSTPPERPRNPTHFGGEGLYESAGVEEATSLRAPLGEHLDELSRQSLQSGQQATASTQSTRSMRSASALMDLVRRNPVPVALALGGLAWMFASRRRRSVWR